MFCFLTRILRKAGAGQSLVYPPVGLCPEHKVVGCHDGFWKCSARPTWGYDLLSLTECQCLCPWKRPRILLQLVSKICILHSRRKTLCCNFHVGKVWNDCSSRGKRPWEGCGLWALQSLDNQGHLLFLITWNLGSHTDGLTLERDLVEGGKLVL